MDQVMKCTVIYSIAVRIFPEPILITKSSLFHLFISLTGLSLYFEHFLNHMQLFYFIHFFSTNCHFCECSLHTFCIHFVDLMVVAFYGVLKHELSCYLIKYSWDGVFFLVTSKRTCVGSNWCKLISMLAKWYEIDFFLHFHVVVVFVCKFFVSIWYLKSTKHNSWHSYTHNTRSNICIFRINDSWIRDILRENGNAKLSRHKQREENKIKLSFSLKKKTTK